MRSRSLRKPRFSARSCASCVRISRRRALETAGRCAASAADALPPLLPDAVPPRSWPPAPGSSGKPSATPSSLPSSPSASKTTSVSTRRRHNKGDMRSMGAPCKAAAATHGKHDEPAACHGDESKLTSVSDAPRQRSCCVSQILLDEPHSIVMLSDASARTCDKSGLVGPVASVG